MGFLGFGKKRGRITEKWSYDAKSPILTSPAVLKNHIVFGTKDGKIVMLDSESNVKWVFDTQTGVSKTEAMFLDVEAVKSIYSTPSFFDINQDGAKEILVGSDNGNVYALDLEGKLLWKLKVGAAVRGSIMFCNEHVFFGSKDGFFYCLDANGSLKWKYNTKSEIESTPICHNGKIIFGVNDGMLYCLDLAGKVLWTYKTGGSIVAQPVVGELEHRVEYIIVGSTDNFMYAIDLNGKPYWKFQTEGRILSKAVIADVNKDGRNEIFFGSCDNNVYALKHNGLLYWSYATDFWVVAPVLVCDVDADGKYEVIAGSYDNNVYVLDAEGTYMLDYMPGLSGIVQQTGAYTTLITSEPGQLVGKKIWEYKTEGIITGSAILDNQVIITTKKGLLDDIIYVKK
ncbi:PQQ-binding-like beta-propeller repeat protein [Candidatus Woesearchaeota archaeon]|nr:PQQ-binding-like beta-propeller repeat protein [Candidatus Woesearchaeota archaeon]